MKPGTKVKLNKKIKQILTKNGCHAHVKEFGDCIGIVEGLVDYGTSEGPEVDVRWIPSGLKYGYHPEELDIVYDKNTPHKI